MRPLSLARCSYGSALRRAMDGRRETLRTLDSGNSLDKLFEPLPLFFLGVRDSKPQERPGAPKTSEEANCLMCDLHAESPTIAAFWNQHPDCQRWNGQAPEGVRLVKSRDKTLRLWTHRS